jgi:HNH endonuclease
MTCQRACIYCRTVFGAATLTAEPVLPAALGGRLALKRAACRDCAARVRELTDDFLATRFALTAGAMTAKRPRRPAEAPPADASPDDWRRAYRAAAKILYCYLLLELGQTVLSSPPAEKLRRHLMDHDAELWPPRWEVTPARQSPSASWHVLMFDSAHSAAAIGLFGTIWFRFHLDLGALAPQGRLVTFDAFKGARGMAMLRSRTGWLYRSAVRWGWKV